MAWREEGAAWLGEGALWLKEGAFGVCRKLGWLGCRLPGMGREFLRPGARSGESRTRLAGRRPGSRGVSGDLTEVRQRRCPIEGAETGFGLGLARARGGGTFGGECFTRAPTARGLAMTSWRAFGG